MSLSLASKVIWILLLEIFILFAEVQKFYKIGNTYIFNRTQIVLSILWNFQKLFFLNRPHIETLKEGISETHFIALIQMSCWRFNQKIIKIKRTKTTTLPNPTFRIMITHEGEASDANYYHNTLAVTRAFQLLDQFWIQNCSENIKRHILGINLV